MIKYIVWVNDDRLEINTNKKLKVEEIATALDVNEEEIIQVEDYEI